MVGFEPPASKIGFTSEGFSELVEHEFQYKVRMVLKKISRNGEWEPPEPFGMAKERNRVDCVGDIRASRVLRLRVVYDEGLKRAKVLLFPSSFRVNELEALFDPNNVDEVLRAMSKCEKEEELFKRV